MLGIIICLGIFNMHDVENWIHLHYQLELLSDYLFLIGTTESDTPPSMTLHLIEIYHVSKMCILNIPQASILSHVSG
jgi:hypothetical protein